MYVLRKAEYKIFKCIEVPRKVLIPTLENNKIRLNKTKALKEQNSKTWLEHNKINKIIKPCIQEDANQQVTLNRNQTGQQSVVGIIHTLQAWQNSQRKAERVKAKTHATPPSSGKI